MSRRPLDPRFADGKEADALRTIGEVAQALGIKPHVLRYWEQQFPMLQPLKRSGGRRYYRREDIALLDRIDRLVNREGYTLKGAKKALQQGQDGAPELAVPAIPMTAPDAGELPLAASFPAGTGAHAPPPEDFLPQLRSIRQKLAAALES
jgi:DNA-binding transcriptional MerR regulator